MSFPKALLVTACVTLLSSSAYAAQQQDQPSVAEAARKARAEKKNPTKPAKVYTDDNIGGVQGPVNVVGQEAPAATAPAAGPSSGNSSQTASAWKAKFSEARKKLADDKRELDLLQREYNLNQTQYYSNPNEALKQQYSLDQQTSMKNKIDERTDDVAKDQQAIDDLEDQLRKSGGDPGWARDDETPSDQAPPAASSDDNSPAGQPTQSQPPAAQDQGSQPSSQDQGSQPQQQPSETPPPSSQP